MVMFASAIAAISVVALGPNAPESAATADDRATYLGQQLYFGEFHSHTGVSDGVDLPPDAFAHVRDEHAADFFAVTEHDVMFDLRNTDSFAEDWADAESDEWRYLHERASEFNAAQEDVVAVPAYETTWYDGTGHINIFNTEWKATARAQSEGSIDGFVNRFGTGDLKYDMYTYFARLKLDPEAIGQFNHPSTTSKGNFFDFNGLDPVVDARMNLIEVKIDRQLEQYQLALDKGWHLSPTYNGDEHGDNWVTGADAITGIWAEEQTLDGLYSAMRARSTYSTLDENIELTFGANGRMMGTVLPSTTRTFAADIALHDADSTDEFTSVKILTNNGKVAHDFGAVSGNSLTLDHTFAVEDGDYYFVKAVQADGDFVVSAPLWIGETTRGAEYAPVISVSAGVPARANYNDSVELPNVTAVDRSGNPVAVTFEVYDSAGEVPVGDGEFQVRSYDDHFIVVKAEDSTGNINAELLRISVNTDDLDPTGVFQYFGSTAVVAAEAGGTGISISTDVTIPQVFAQVRPVGGSAWVDTPVLREDSGDVYEVSTIGRDAAEYKDQITGQPLRSHEFRVDGLDGGKRYEYRFGVSADRAEAGAWSDVGGEFVAGGAENEPVYVVGDLQVTDHSTEGLGLLRDTLDTVRAAQPGGETLVQLGDLVDNGGRGEYWQEVWDNVFSGLDVQYAPVAGNHETYGDLDYNSLTTDRTAIFSNMFATPDNGVVGESNYSFDRGDVHYSVLNSNFDLDEQLEWLVQDVRESNAPWHVVMGHFSYYGGSHGNDAGMASDRAKVSKVLANLGVNMYLGAHDHVYKRSVIYDGRLAQTPEEVASGVTYVTMGSSGPKFYDNVVHPWDDVVFDEDTQLGAAIQVEGDGLKFTSYTIDGDVVDEFTVQKPTGTWRVSSTDLVDKALPGVGLLSYEGSRDNVTVTAATYDASQARLIHVRTVDVALDGRGVEQFVEFASPLPVGPSDTVKIFLWDSLVGGPSALPAMTLREGLEGAGTADDPYLIRTGTDISKIGYDPEGYYALANDLNLSGVDVDQIGISQTFTGVFDGAGYVITGYVAPNDTGMGLFAVNHGTIRNVHVDSDLTSTASTVGMIVDLNYGTVENSWTSGSITGLDLVGGIAGESHGAVLNSYSTADVTATGSYAGGIVALQRGEAALTESVYSTGLVQAAVRNAGGLVSYARDEPTIRTSVSLNSAVRAPSWSHAILGRAYGSQEAALEDNSVSELTYVAVQSQPVTGVGTLMGTVVTAAATQSSDLFVGLGWDFAATWEWNDAAGRPTLTGNPEAVTSVGPNLPRDASGAYRIGTVEDLSALSDFPSERFILTTDLDLTGSDFEPLNATVPFAGDLNGDGHVIRGLTSSRGGLFAILAGSVHDLGLVGADVNVDGDRVGIVAGESSGLIERVYVTGSVTGTNRVGGLVGEGSGTVRDSYTLADVRATYRYAGGVVGIASSGAHVEDVYALGAVVADDRNAGGVVSYGYTGTIVKTSVSLNSQVTSPDWSHAIVGRVAAGQVASLEGNEVGSAVPVAGERPVTEVPGPGHDTLRGEVVDTRQLRSANHFTATLEWDLADVWKWSSEANRPMLRAVPEPYVEVTPELPLASDGFYEVDSVEDLAQVDLFPSANFRLVADIDLGGVSDFEPLNVLAPFGGVLDGNGRVIQALSSTKGGLFSSMAGTVTDLGIVGAKIDADATYVGILADRSSGTVERVFTTGVVNGSERVGGVIGQLDTDGVLSDAYSTATVRADGSYSGGVVGITSAGTLTERVYSSGAVSAGHTGAGGISSYAYTDTTVADAVAINQGVAAGGNGANAIVGKVKGSPTLRANVHSDAVSVSALDAQIPALMGTSVPDAIAKSASLYQGDLGWDFDSVWQWDSGALRPLLQSTPEPLSSAEVPGVDVAIQISSVAELQAVADHPDYWFVLSGDIDLSGVDDFVPLGSTVPFTGTFDGASYKILGLTSTSGGLFDEVGVGGRVFDLSVMGAGVEVDTSHVGILANRFAGDADRIYTSGSVTGTQRIGGIVGNLTGNLRDSYSEAEVRSSSSYAGGVVGIADHGSTVQRVYATGAVESSNTAGGIAGYVYTDTRLEQSFALNPTVSGSRNTHRVVGRVGGDATPPIVDNRAGDVVEASVQRVTDVGAATLNGETVTSENSAVQSTWEDGLGWNFTAVWQWNDELQRPVLRGE